MSSPRPVLLLTRPEEGSRRFLDVLDQDLLNQVDVVVSPLLEIVPLSAPVDVTEMRGLIFSSQNGVRVAASKTSDRSLPAFCVGAATTAAAQNAGWQSQRMGEDAETLVAALCDLKPQSPLLHLRGRHARGDVATRLTANGLSTAELVIYDQQAQTLNDAALQALTQAERVIAPLFSPRTAEVLAHTAPDCTLTCAAFSSAVAQKLKCRKTWSTHIAQAPHSDEMARLVENLLRSRLSG
jgi:uroporphyrinogen-III synthase